jgi:hypothetical protein
MIHYTCDCCQRSIESDDVHYIVKMEIFAAFEPGAVNALDDDRDHLQEIQEILQHTEDAAGHELDSEVYEQLQFDLCPECRKKFLKHPLGRALSKQFDFSEN